MGAIRRPDRRGEWWVDFRYRRRRIRRRSPVQTKRGAEQYERQLRQEYSQDEVYGKNPFEKSITFSELATRWFTNYVEVNNRPSTQYSKRKAFEKHLLPEFGSCALPEITDERVAAFAARLAKSDLAPKTVNNILSMLHCALASARSWKLLREIPEVRWQRVPMQGYRYLEPNQAQRILDAAKAASDSQFWHTLILFCLRTGGRFSEVAVLRWDDLVLEGPRCHVKFWRGRSLNLEGPTKTNRCRDVPLSSDLVAVLRTYPRDSERIFARSDPERPIVANNLFCTLTALCRRAGVPRVSWKDLRHTFATDLTRAGVPLNVVSRLLGHTTLQMTMRYAHVPEEAMYDAVELLANR